MPVAAHIGVEDHLRGGIGVDVAPPQPCGVGSRHNSRHHHPPQPGAPGAPACRGQGAADDRPAWTPARRPCDPRRAPCRQAAGGSGDRGACPRRSPVWQGPGPAWPKPGTPWPEGGAHAAARPACESRPTADATLHVHDPGIVGLLPSPRRFPGFPCERGSGGRYQHSGGDQNGKKSDHTNHHSFLRDWAQAMEAAERNARRHSGSGAWCRAWSRSRCVDGPAAWARSKANR